MSAEKNIGIEPVIKTVVAKLFVSSAGTSLYRMNTLANDFLCCILEGVFGSLKTNAPESG